MKNVMFNDEDFKKSTLSRGPGGGPGRCVEVAHKEGIFAVRNSNDTSKLTVTFTKEEWIAFVGGVKLGEFDY